MFRFALRRSFRQREELDAAGGGIELGRSRSVPLQYRKVVEDYRILHGSEETDEYRLSPIRATIERRTPLRRRLDRPVPEYPLLDRIRKAGGTDYFALALNRKDRRLHQIPVRVSKYKHGVRRVYLAFWVGLTLGNTSSAVPLFRWCETKT